MDPMLLVGTLAAAVLLLWMLVARHRIGRSGGDAGDGHAWSDAGSSSACDAGDGGGCDGGGGGD